jgi:hypothetical protein
MPRVGFGDTEKVVQWIRTGKPGTVKQFRELIARRLGDLGKDPDRFAPFSWDGQEPATVNVASFRRCVENAEGDDQVEIIGRWKATIDDRFRMHGHPTNEPTDDQRLSDHPRGVAPQVHASDGEQNSDHEAHATNGSTIKAARMTILGMIATGAFGSGVTIMLAGWHVAGVAIAAAGLLLALLAWFPDADRIGQVVSQRGQVLDVHPFRFLLHRDTEDLLSGLTSPKGRLMLDRTVYFSYAWRDDREMGRSREDIVDRLYDSLNADGYDVRRDKMNLGYKGLISQFMAEIGRGACVVVVISDKYLHSPYCMWELLQIYRNLQFHERICPIVLADAKIHSMDGRSEYVDFWQKEKKRVDSRVKKLGIEALSTEGTLREAEKVREISHTVDKLLTFVADMNTLNPDLLAANNFETLKRAIDERVRQMR